MKRLSLILLVLPLLFSSVLWADEIPFAQADAPAATNYSTTGRNFKRGVAAVMFSTIGGAVLGLSTLSFYGRPQEHTGNIGVGALLGLAAGVGYVSYDANRGPSKASSNYDYSWQQPDENLRRSTLLAKSKELQILGYQFDF